MKKVLITGAKGQLSKCIESSLVNFENVKAFFLSADDLDITNYDKASEVFKDITPDFIINCAAYTAVDKAESEKELAFMVNSEGVENLAKLCTVYKAKLVHISTDFVFDGNSCVPYTEDSNTNPLSVYGKSKLRGEELIKKAKCDFYIFRTSWLYSEYGHNFLKTMLRLGTQKDQIKVVYDQVGSPTYAKDLAEFVLNFIVSDENFEYGIYHYSNEGVASWYDFAEAIFDEKNIEIHLEPISTEEYPTPAMRPNYSVMSKDKIKSVFNIKINHWRQSLRKCLNNV
ncbi:MAG: dTDP-4-dehydrorhamnose reductase [Winogradskyella sp.]|uniref:dTDP-4-dehydrorhamnose reductase n=1 Tax=Winogradskyella sp. TaxID=1883156 RepID=UPI000F402E1E|nr:dTDP-4-dehydrorhamnose reductase [Winogradskyella sp.]RNC88165.1 MAG: dTDP-4-dehydrorhamnose reductase [Winogradskyella sp.]